MQLSELRFHVPCGITDKPDIHVDQRLAQVEERINLGFSPGIILKKPLSPETFDRLKRLVRENRVDGIGFDMGQIKGSAEDYTNTLDQISALRDSSPEKVESTVGIKLGSAIDYGDKFTGLNSTFSFQAFTTAFDLNLDSARELNVIARERDLDLAIENRPRPNYGFFPKGASSGAPIDPTPRWGGKWSAWAQFIGTIGSSAQELIGILDLVPGTKLQLDLEHIAQTCQFGGVFNMEDRGAVLYGRDLTSEQKEILEPCGVDCSDDKKLFDYSSLSDAERRVMRFFGFAIREGQPLVYQQQITLKNELDLLAENSVVIESITPGFQVYQGLRDGQNVIIGSHMPGITPQYISDPQLRATLRAEVAKTHRLCWDFMRRKGIRDVEIEFQVDDGTRTVYSGPVWQAQINEGIRQLKENFESAEQ